MVGRDQVASALAMWLALVGCSSTTNNIVNANCGPGTVLKDGVCAPAEDGGGGDASGDTSVATDGGGEVGSDAGSDTPGDGAPLPGDDPCPPVVDSLDRIVNCSKTCPPVDEPECRGYPGPGSVAIAEDSFVRVVRTPAKPGADGDKWRDPGCPLQKWYAARITITGAGASNEVRARVAAPWFLVDSVCVGPKAGTSCMVGHYFQVVTTDPNAPSRNVEIEVVPAGTASCP